MLGMVLLEFLCRFAIRTHPAKLLRWQPLLFCVVFLLQLAVILSRLILGMHAFNQVLIGAVMGLYSLLLYYTLAEKWILRYLTALVRTKRRNLHTAILGALMVGCLILEYSLYSLPQYNNSDYWDTIITVEGCESSQMYKSFHHKCLQDSALIMAGFGLAIGLLWMDRPSTLLLPLAYSRLSCRWLLRLLILVVCAGVVVLVFVNPFWTMLSLSAGHKAVLVWALQSVGFFAAIVSLLVVGPRACGRCGLEEYDGCRYRLPVPEEVAAV